MGITAGAIFDTGVNLGLASFQASRVPSGSSFDGHLVDFIYNGLTSALRNVEILNGKGIDVPVQHELHHLISALRPALGIAGDPHNLQIPIEGLRGDVRGAIMRRPVYLPVYDLGVAIALAEGQASVADGDHNAIPHRDESLRHASIIVQQLGHVVNAAKIAEVRTFGASHAAILAVRQEYERAFGATALM